MTPEGIALDTAFSQPDVAMDYKVNIFGLGKNEWLRLRESVDELSTNKDLQADVITQLTRLGATTTGNTYLNAEQRLQVTIAATTRSTEAVAKQISVHHDSVKRSARDTLAALIFLQGKRNDEVFSKEVEKRVDKLAEVDKELTDVAQVMKFPPIQRARRQLPHVDALLKYYLKYRTVSELLKECKVPFTSDQIASIRKFLLGKTIDDSIDGISILARRYVLGNWLYIDRDKDSVVSQAAVLVLKTDHSKLPKRFRTRIRRMRLSLIERMNTEYKSMRNAIREDMTLFPSNYDGELSTVIEAYRRFADAGYCPMSIKKHAELAVAGTPQKERSEQIRSGEYYSKALRLNYDQSLINFLEITLIRPGVSTHDTTLNVFNLYPQQVLRRAKERVLEAS